MPSMYIKELALLVKLSPRRLYQINEELEPDKKLFVRDSPCAQSRSSVK